MGLGGRRVRAYGMIGMARLPHRQRMGEGVTWSKAVIEAGMEIKSIVRLEGMGI